jgi:hypothetical protein
MVRAHTGLVGDASDRTTGYLSPQGRNWRLKLDPARTDENLMTATWNAVPAETLRNVSDRLPENEQFTGRHVKAVGQRVEVHQTSTLALAGYYLG